MLNYTISNDNGNSEQEIIIDGALVVQPNVNCEVAGYPDSPKETSKENMVKNIMDNLVVTVSSECINDKGTYFVGNLALDSGEVLNNMQVGLDSKSDNDLPIVNTLAVIAGRALQDTYYKTNNSKKKSNTIPERIEVTVRMATALPVIQFSKENASVFEDKFTQERHNVILHVSKEIDVEVDIDFSFVKVLPESTTVTFALQKDTKGNVRKGDIFDPLKGSGLPSSLNGTYFEDQRLLHVDIGDGTTEYCITEGNAFLQNFTTGSNNGVGHAIESALSDFNKAIHVIDSPRQFLSEVIKDEDHKYYDIARDVLSKPLRIQSNQIIRHTKALITKARNDVDFVVVYGGGSIAMYDELIDPLTELCEERDVNLFYIGENYATILGVDGLYAFTQTPIFKLLEERKVDSYL